MTVGKFIRKQCVLINPKKARDLFYTYGECVKTTQAGMSMASYKKRCSEIFRGWNYDIAKGFDPFGNVIGVIGDTHCPYEMPHYLDFCYDTFKKHGVNKVIHIGDVVDNHALSFHLTETCALSPQEEYELAKTHVAKYVEAFPDVILCRGNHDAIPRRQAATLGIPDVFLKSFNELWGLPETWKIVEDIVINDVWYFHGSGSTGKTPAFNRALYNRMSTVQGHAHSAFGCMYTANTRDVVFGVDSGCGINNKLYAFSYGKPFPKKPILGCGVIYSSSEAYAIPMNEKYFRD